MTSNTADDLSPVWSPDGTKIAFVSSRNGNDEIYTMSATGGNQVNISNSPYDDYEPASSSDGAKLAFVSNRDGNDEIYTMDATGGAQANISNNTAEDHHPSWAGTRIAFQSLRDGNDEIYIMNSADGGGQTRLTTSAAPDIEPWLSNDGTRIAFASGRDSGGNFEVYVMGANGSNQTRLTNTPDENDVEASVQRQAATVPAAANALVQFQTAQGGALSIAEGIPSVTVQVTRTGDTSGVSTVDYAATSGTASERADFETALGTLRFSAGETGKSFTISIIDDGFAETDETINLTLGNPTGAGFGATTTITLTITDNDLATAAANPVNTPEFFVRQHYLDFLNREPEEAGFNAWVNLLRNCQPNDTKCDRIEVSAAFFRSPEYQLKGYYVIRFYLAALGRLPTYREFIRDTQRINAPTGAEVIANQAAYANEFTQRADFLEIYSALSNAAYVDRILQTAGITLASRDQLVSDLSNNMRTRGQVLRAVIESAEFFTKEYNRGFVASQYYGYLRRDIDVTGFNGWLAYLNSHPGDYRTMVNGFVNSVEYRARFGVQ